MRFAFGLSMLFSVPVSAQVSLVDLQRRSAQSIENHIQIAHCTKIQNAYGKWAHDRRVQLEAVSSDNVGGFIDSGLVADSYYTFGNAFALVRDKIQAIQHSDRPDAGRCQAIADSVKDRLRSYLKGLLTQ